jgi:hypothetical protein
MFLFFIISFSLVSAIYVTNNISNVSNASTNSTINNTSQNITVYVHDDINFSTTTGKCSGKKCLSITVNNETILVNPKNIKANSTFQRIAGPAIIALVVLAILGVPLYLSRKKKVKEIKEKEGSIKK